MTFDTIQPGREDFLGRGPYGRLVLRGVTVIDGSGAPAYGPADIVIAGDRIEAIVSAGRNTDMSQRGATSYADAEVLDLTSHFVLPGFIDAHTHLAGRSQVHDADYMYRLWLGHGITTIREVGSIDNGLEFSLSEAAKSEANTITAPRIVPYYAFGVGREEPIRTAYEAQEWVAQQAEAGAAGIKFFGAPPEPFEAGLREAVRLGLGTACHHAPADVARVNAMTTSRWGLSSIEHGYGLAESMFVDHRVQRYPASYNYNDEHARFAQYGQLWREAAEPGSGVWDNTIAELIDLGTTLDPTFVVYVAARDAARARGREYHRDYTAPLAWKFFQPGSGNHGSFFSDWGTEEEVSWKENYRLWMAFVRDFYVRGGRVTVGSDAGFIFNLYGFGYVEELELMREAGLHPLEVIQCATSQAAGLLGRDDLGLVEPGKRADLVVVAENPLQNLKTLYGHGHLRVDEGGAATRVGGVTYTIKNGVVFDAGQLRSLVREQVAHEREEAGLVDPFA